MFKKINWPSVLFIVGYHIGLCICLPIYLMTCTFSFKLLGIALIIWYLAGLGITVGYHRYFSHKTFKANRWVEWALLFLGTVAIQGSALRWSYDHRLHHSHIDQDDDPYAVKDGFWHAHILWMFKAQRPMDKPKIVSDLLKNKVVVFQHKYYAILMALVNIAITLFFGWIAGSFFGSFVLVFLLRVFLLHHGTWFINSLAHYWGHQNYSSEHSAVDNYIISLLTFGEGYHNYHHTFANDYRNGIKWYHYDPTKWIIFLLSKLKLASKLRKVADGRISQKMIEEHKRILEKKVASSSVQSREKLGENIKLCSQKLLDKIKNYLELKQEIKIKSTKELKKAIKKLKAEVKQAWSKWSLLSKEILNNQNEHAA